MLKRPILIYPFITYFAIKTVYGIGLLFLLNIALEGQSPSLEFLLVYSLIIVNIIIHFFLAYRYFFAKRRARILTVGVIVYSNILAFTIIMTYGSLLGIILVMSFVAIPSLVFLILDGIAIYCLSRNVMAQYFKNSR